MGSHGRNRIHKGGPVMKLQPVNGMIVVADPVLRIVGEHGRVKTSASSAAALEQNIRVGFDNSVHHPVQTKNITMIDLALLFCRKLIGPDIGKGTVDIPFYVENVGAVKNRIYFLNQIILHIPAAHIENHLIAAAHCMAARNLHSPFRVGTVKVAVFRNHFRLKPDAEFHSQLMNLIHQLMQAAFNLIFIHIPVAKAAVVVIPFSEPAVIHNKKVNAHFFCRSGNFHQLYVVKIHKGRFPAIDQHRPSDILYKFAFAQI